MEKCKFLSDRKRKAMDTIEQPPTSHTVQLEASGENILHFAALPEGVETVDPVDYPEEPVLTYPFPLDDFQKCAIGCVHANQSVLVSAHTSAGKTAIAYYAIALALKNNSRVIYTSPIKALSNQKYVELSAKFGDVGLMTGDFTLNENASCLVMTTEILRMMLFKGAPLIHEVSWIIYDEVHYMKDPDRGVVWEESIILLPHSVHFVFLSATIPNAKEFSEWIAQIHQQTCHVVYTEHRPVPLRYYLAPMNDQKIYLVRTADGEIDDRQFNLACAAANTSSTAGKTVGGVTVRGAETSGKPSLKQMRVHTCNTIHQLFQSDLYPMIVFVFSRAECSRLPDSLGDKSFNKKPEMDIIDEVFEKATYKLDPEDRNLPQVQRIHDLVRRGIGVHHGGLLPLMKEIVEVLLEKGFIKILFATETFAMGLNMPAKTVLFHMLHKFDGSERRLVHPGEFIQMSGRAGRRNRDDFGVVVVNYTGEVPPADLKTLMTASALPLNSEFRVTYNMLLNLLPASGLSPREVMRRSFHQFQMVRELPELIQKRKDAQAKADSIILANETIADALVKAQNQLSDCEDRMHSLMTKPENIVPVLTPGRFVFLKDWGWSVIVAKPDQKASEFVVLTAGVENFDRRISPPKKGCLSQPYLIPGRLSSIVHVGGKELKISFDSMTNELMKGILATVRKQEAAGIPIVDPTTYMNNSDDRERFESLRKESANLQRQLEQSSVDQQTLALYREKKDLLDEVERMSSQIDIMNHLVMQKDLEAMIKVLKAMGYLSEEGIVQQKGHCASRVNAGNELVFTELLFNNAFANLSPEEIAAFMKSYVAGSAPKVDEELAENMKKMWDLLQKEIKHVATVSENSGYMLDIDKFKAEFSTQYIEICSLWAQKVSFATIMENRSDPDEGSIVRVMKRLDELLQQAAYAASIIQNAELERKFKEASELIKRGIVFAASLYATKTT